jgi:hypothetical protein
MAAFACRTSLIAATPAGDNAEGLGAALASLRTLDGASDFQNLQPKNLGSPGYNFAMEPAVRDEYDGLASAGAEGNPREFLVSAGGIEKLWTNDRRGYCVSYYTLLDAMLHRAAPLDLSTVEATVNPLLARTENAAVSDQSPRLAQAQALAVRLLLKTVWNGVPTPETMRTTDRCLSIMETWRREIQPRQDSLQTGGFHVLFRTETVKIQAKQFLIVENEAAVVRQSIWRSEISEISAITLKVLNEAGSQFPALAEASAPLAKRAEALGEGLFDDREAR